MPPPIKVDFADNLPANLPRPLSLRLSVELIPQTTWGDNLRSLLTHEQWNVLRRAVYARADYICEICSSKSIQVHCHEVWSYDDNTHTQRLIGLRCLCWECHAATHMHSETGGSFYEDLEHYARINGVTVQDARNTVLEAYKQFRERSNHEWTLDTNWLNDYLQREKERDGQHT